MSKKRKPYVLTSSGFQQMRRAEAARAKLGTEAPLPAVGEIVTVEVYSVGNLRGMVEELSTQRVRCEVVAVNKEHRHYTVRTPWGYCESFKQGCTK